MRGWAVYGKAKSIAIVSRRLAFSIPDSKVAIQRALPCRNSVVGFWRLVF